MHSSKLHTLAHKLLAWSRRLFLSLRAIHVPGILKRETDLILSGNPLDGHWRLHPQAGGFLWQRFSKAAMALFASRNNARCPMFFLLRDEDAPLSVDELAHPWSQVLLYVIPPLCLIVPSLARLRDQNLTLILKVPRWPKAPWLVEILPLLYVQPWPSHYVRTSGPRVELSL